MTTQNNADQTVYISYQSNQPDKVALITTDSDKASLQEMVLGFPTHKTIPMLAAVTLYQKPNLYHLIDADTWGTVAQGFDEFQAKGIINEQASEHDREPVVGPTPTDLPLNATKARFRLIQDFQNPANIPRQKELTEILMADKEGRPVNQEVFSEESRQQPTWAQQIATTEPGEFQTRSRYLSRLYQQVHQSNEATLRSGKNLSAESALQARQLLVAMMELNHLHTQQTNPLTTEDLAKHHERTRFEESEGLFGGYPIYRETASEGRVVEAIVLDWTKAINRGGEGLSIGTKTPISDLISEIKPHRLTDKMSDTDWKITASAMRDVAQEYRRTNAPFSPMFPVNSPDLPLQLVSDRLDTLIDHFDPEHDLGAYVELCELECACLHQCPADGNLFTSASWDESWQIPDDVPIEVLEKQIDRIVKDNLATTDPRELARQQQLVRETEYTLENVRNDTSFSLAGR